MKLTGVLLLAALGCQTTEEKESQMLTPLVPTVTAARVASSDPSWPSAASMTPMTLNAPAIADGKLPLEPGRFAVTYDAEAVYLSVELTGHDLVTTAVSDHDILYTAGDVAEWFIGTPPSTPETDLATSASGRGQLPGRYLELHAAPNGVRSAYLITRPVLPEAIKPLPFEAEVKLRGTLNDDADRDEGWSVRFILPWSSLQKLDPTLAPDADLTGKLTMLVGRYNFGHHLPYQANGQAGPELTMWPPQPKTAFHLRPFHAPIHFQP